MATGLFDDLIPQAPRNVTGAFDDLIPATTGQGLLGAAQRGVQSAQQVFPVFQLLGAQDRGPSIRQERAAFEQAMSDPRYMASLTESFDEPLRAAKVEETLGPERKLADIRQRQEAVKQIWSGVVTDIEKEKAATPKSAAQVELSQAQTAGDKWRAWLKNPVELTATIVAESLPASIAGAVLGTATAGPGIGTAAGVGLSSFATTLSSELLNEANRLGYDTSDQQSLERFVSSQDFDRAFNTATTKAAPVANIDAATAGAAGRFIAPAIKQGLGSAARATGKEVLQQAIGGSGGEFVGQTLAGQPKDWFDIAMEGVAEIFTAPGEAISNIRRTRRIGAEPQDRPVISRIERPPDATTQREIQEGVQPQRIETTTRGVPDEAGTRDIVQPTTPVQTQTPEIVQVPALAPGAFKPGDQIAQYGRVLNVDMDQGTVTTQSEDGRRYVLIGQQEIPIATVVEPAPDQPVFPLRKGTTTPWEDQRGRPVRLIPDPANPDRQKWTVEEAPATPPAPEQKIAPVTYRGFQEGIPGKFEGFHLYNLTETISPTLVKGSTVTEQKLNAEGFTVPESVKPVPVPVAPPTDIQVIGQVTPERQPLLDEVLARIREENANTPGLPIRRVELHRAPAGVGIVSTQPGRAMFDTVALDLDQLAASGIADIDQFLSLAINEEIIHNAGGLAIRDEWDRHSAEHRQSIPFHDYWSGRMDVIAGEMTPAQLARVRQVYGQELTDRVAAAEFVRMLVQERMRGQITEETLGRNTIQYLKQILRRLLDALRTATGTSRQNLQQHVNAIEEILRGQQQIRTVEEQQQVGLTDDEITRLGAASPSLPTLRWNPDQSQAGFGLMGVAALNNPAAEPLKMAGRINPQQLINRLRTILPPDEWAWYQNAGIERLAGATALADVGIPGGTAGYFSRWLQQNGPKVEVKELKAVPDDYQASPVVTELRQQNAVLIHELDTRLPGWRQMASNQVPEPFRELYNRQYLLSERLTSLEEPVIEERHDSATARYTSVNPKPLEQMPGAVDLLVRVPIKATENKYGPKPEVLFKGPHFGMSDLNVLASIRGYMETLPNGRKTFHIFEVQSDWGQKRREGTQDEARQVEQSGRIDPNYIRVPDHPLLRDYNRLAIKAAIKHAIDNGADSITISDAETAMLTEGHDRAAQRTLEIPATPSNIALAQHKLALAKNNPERGQLFENELQTLAFGTPIRVTGTQAQRVGEARNEGWEYKEVISAPQEPGMRLNYDQVLPRIARELTGMEGAPVNLGTHQNALKTTDSVEGLAGYPRPDLIFRNPDGTPKTSITGRTFDLTATKQRLNQTGGVFPLFGSGKFVSESPFDRMRRESGAEAPPELTPEQQRAREINERIRGRRPETLSAASPKTQEEMDRELAVKEAEEEGWVKHRALGVDDWVLARDQWTDEEKLRSRQQAEETFTNAGIPHTWNEQNRYFDIQPGATVEAQYRLLDLVKEAMRRQNWPKEPEVAALIASITANAKLGQTDYFDSYVRRQLYKLTRSEASHRGALLGALSHFARDIREVSLRVEEILERTWADAYGGPAVEKVAEDLAKLVAQMSKAKEVADRILAKAPELTQAGVDAGLIGQIFQMPFFTQAELKERFIAAVVKKTRVTPAEATKLWNVFKEKFDPIRRELGRLALAEVKSLLRPDQRHLIKKPIWQKIQSMVDAGEFDAGHILKIIAGEKGWRTPTPEEISKLRQLARRERELRELNDKERAEVEKFAPNDEKALVKAQLEKEKKTEQQRNAILKEMDTRWARFTRPISLNPFKWFGLRHNTASAGLELIAANLLATIGFPFRLSISIASQILPHMTLTPIAYSWQQHQGTLDTLEGQKNFIRDAYLGLEDSISAYLKSVKPAAYAARAAFLGRGEQRNVLRLTSSIAAFDRIRLMAQEEFEKGNVAKAWALKTLGFLDIGFRAARALDAFQTLPAETAEMYHQIRLEMGSQGKSLTEIKNNQYTIMDRIFREWMQAIADTKKGLADAGVTDATEAQIKEIAWTLIRQRQYQKANELKLSGDDWQRMNRLLKSTLAWNEAETKGAGGVVGGALKRIQRGVSKGLGIPTDIGVFSNAIATAINRQLHFTPAYHFMGGGRGEGSPWFATEIDRKRRALDALAGTGFGGIVIAMVLMGIIKVQLPRRMDDDEKEKFIAEGHRFGTVEFQYGDTFVPVSMNNSPLWIVAPYLAGAGALMDLWERRQKEQEKLNAEAAKKGLPPGKIRPMDPGDMAGVAGQAIWQTIFGSRTFSGFLGSIASYGEKLNTRRIIAGRIAPMVPGLPAVREVVSRMGGVTLNNQMATIWDYMLPLPSSQAAMVNKLGDPVRTPSDLQRVVQVLSGGNYGPVAKQETQAYQTLYGSEFKPPTISPNKGYQFPDSFRPMNDRELSRYSILRGRYFQEGLAGVAAGDEAAVKSAYQQAERRALTEVGVEVPAPKATTARGTTTTRRTGVRGPRRLRSVSRLRRPRLRRLSYRRPRLAVRRPRLRRIRRLAA